MTDLQMLEQYQQETEGHHAFQLKDGSYYEGYILVVNQSSILFRPAAGVMDDQETWERAMRGELDLVILIDQIDLTTLRR